MMKLHVLEVLSKAAHMSSSELDQLIREKKDDVVLSIQKENIRIGGEERMVRRVFARASSALEYSRVGWVLNDDIDKCMTCSKEFWFFHSRIHCRACGNINCGDCAAAFCLVDELPDQDRGVSVCSQCYWGQDVVTCFYRKGVDDDFQAATSRWTDSTLQNSSAISAGFNSANFSDDDSEDSFQQDDGRCYSSDSDSDRGSGSKSDRSSSADSEAEEQAREKARQQAEEEAAAAQRRFEAEQARKAERLATQGQRNNSSVHSGVHFGTGVSDSPVSNTKSVAGSTTAQSPEPLFVMKTTRCRSSRNVFVNICTLPDIDMVVEFGCTSGLCMNGSGLESTDKYSGDPITIFDVLVNTLPSSRVHFDKRNLRDWMDDVYIPIVELINKECFENLDTSPPSFPKTKYKGIDVKAFDVGAASAKFHAENTRRLHEATALRVRQEQQAKKERDAQDAKEALERERQEEIARQFREVDEARAAEEEARERGGRERLAAEEARAVAETKLRDEAKMRRAAENAKAEERARREKERQAAEEQEQEEARQKQANNKALAQSQALATEKANALVLAQQAAATVAQKPVSQNKSAAKSLSPSPLFVIKTRRGSSGDKVFINVCFVTAAALVRAEGGGGSSGLHLNGETPSRSVDRSGETCFVYDVVLNIAKTAHDLDAVDSWRADVGVQAVVLVNRRCGDTLDEASCKYPHIKGNYYGTGGVKLFDTEAELATETPVVAQSRAVGTSAHESPDASTEGTSSATPPPRAQATAAAPAAVTTAPEEGAVDKRRVSEVGARKEYIAADDLAVLRTHTITPLFVIKTKRLTSSEKVFINVCTVSSLDLVAALSAPRGLLLNGKEALESADKFGETCFTFDVIVNTHSPSDMCYNPSAVAEWREKVGAALVAMINQQCGESLDAALKFPKIKGNYRGDGVKAFTPSEEHPVQRGWLKKQSRGGFIKNWKSRYFVLTGGELQYYEEARPGPPYGASLKGSMDLAGAHVEERGGLQFMVVAPAGTEKDLLVEAEEATSKQQWMQAINAHIEE